MKRIYHIARFIVLSTLLWGCAKDQGPSVDDHFLNYEIAPVPVTSDYIVGAYYYTFGTFNANVKEQPTLGRYNTVNSQVPESIMTAQIAYALKGGLDYFIFTVRSPNLAAGNYLTDSLMLASFLQAPNNGNMGFALSYNLATGTLGNISPTQPIESLPDILESFYQDFERMAYFFDKSNYMKVNGKTLLIINNAHQLAANDNPAIYNEIRRRLTALGFELYIVGMQNQWTPPQRFYFRFEGCVDAMIERDMINVGNNPDRAHLFPQYVDQNWNYWKKMVESWNIEFIPCISPAYSYKINTPTSTNLEFPRGDNGQFYRIYCNVAKRNASQSRLVFIDSWNDWSLDTQLEPAESYGELYLNITREEFKVQ